MREMLRKTIAALDSVAQLVGTSSCNWKLAHSVPWQGTCLGAYLIPSQGTYKKQLTDVSLSHWCFSLCLCLPFPLSWMKMKKKNFTEKKEGRKEGRTEGRKEGRKTIAIQWFNILGWSSEDHTIQNSEAFLGNYYDFCSLEDWYVEMSHWAMWMSLGLYQVHASILFYFAVLAKCWVIATPVIINTM